MSVRLALISSKLASFASHGHRSKSIGHMLSTSTPELTMIRLSSNLSEADIAKADIHREGLDNSISRAVDSILASQKRDGSFYYGTTGFIFPIADFLLYLNFFGENLPKQAKLADYIRKHQIKTGGWGLTPQSTEVELSISVRAYLALKLVGDHENSSHMELARQAILENGGAEKANNYTRFFLVVNGIIPKSGLPTVPNWIILLPQWFPFTIYKISCWSRNYLVPNSVVMSHFPKMKPNSIMDEIFIKKSAASKILPRSPHQNAIWFWFFSAINSALNTFGSLIPHKVKSQATAEAIHFVEERLNGEDSIIGYPAAMQTTFMYHFLGFDRNHPKSKLSRGTILKLLEYHEDASKFQFVRSPVWDTALTVHALLESEDDRAVQGAQSAVPWLVSRQILDIKGDWAVQKPDAEPGGWPFQYNQPHYPDLDDTAVVASSILRLHRMLGRNVWQKSVQRAKSWLVAMQSRNGGWAAYDADNTCFYLNNIPFADHSVLLDPPTVDVTARVLSFLSEFQSDVTSKRDGLEFIMREQESNGSWWGRWGVNYIYGTWSALSALNAMGLTRQHQAVDRAVRWLLSIQNEDGGWGEDPVVSYKPGYAAHKPTPSTASQTAWALLGLMAAGEINSFSVSRGVEYLLDTQQPNGLWHEKEYTGTGHMNIVYMRYDVYSKCFPLWAICRYRNLKRDSKTTVQYSMYQS